MLTTLRYFALGRQVCSADAFEFMSTGGASNTAGRDRARSVSRVRPEPSDQIGTDAKEGTPQVERAGFIASISRMFMPTY